MPSPSRAFLLCVLLGLPPQAKAENPVDEVLRRSERVLWIGAHPDDENCCAALLAKAKSVSGRLSMISLTRGENSDVLWDGLRRGSQIGAARAELFARSASLLRADDFELGPFVNGPRSLRELDALPLGAPFRGWSARRTTPEEVIRKWKRDSEDPLEYTVRQIRSRRPDAIVSMDDHCGVTGNPEHLAAGRLVRLAVASAADAEAYPKAGKPWKVRRILFTAKIIAPLEACGYCKCRGPEPAEAVEEEDSLRPSRLHRSTYFGAACLVAKQYQNAMQDKGWSFQEMLALCGKAQQEAYRLRAAGEPKQPQAETYRVVSP